MSEEILKALMQLFAITTKQEKGVTASEREYVKEFLLQQLNSEAAAEYLKLYDEFAKFDTSKWDDRKEKAGKRVSIGDSLKTLTICKEINKTLTQKQKIVVTIRLLELINADNVITQYEKEIVDTATLVFNIDKEEYRLIENVVISKESDTQFFDDILIINNKLSKAVNNNKHIHRPYLNGNIIILHIKSVDMYFLKYIGNSDLYLNGLQLSNNKINLFAPGSTIKLPKETPIYYSDISTIFLEDTSFSKVSFSVNNIEYKFPNGNIGLRNINITEESGQLIGIMGASGAGKTTLMNVLSGIETPTSGVVNINGINIHEDKEKIEGMIGYVAQDDILMKDLTVFENLYYNAKLCFKDLTQSQVTSLVLKTLSNLGLLEIKDIRVGSVLNKKISGGQRKRLNIALELIREPTVMFLDEPTSGLSSKDSENIIDLLKELTTKGKLVFVNIHQPSSEIYKIFDKIIILDIGGYQIYYSNPVEAVIYFKTLAKQINSDIGQCPECGNVNPELIFNIIDAKVVDEYGRFTDNRKITPGLWYQFYLKNVKAQEAEEIIDVPIKSLKIPTKIKQLIIFIKRDFLSKIRNRQYLLINLLEVPVLAFILSFIVRYMESPYSDMYLYRKNDNIPTYIFISVIVVLFIGLTVSAEEIFKDRKILKRESFLNLSRSSYLCSKIVILFSLSALQTLIFVLIGNGILEIKGMYFEYWAVLFSISCLANIMGLNISATFNSAVTIYIIIPFLIIPAMILGGAMISFEKLNRAIGGGYQVPLIADLMPSRWAYEALMVNQFINNKFEQNFYEIEKKESINDFKQAYYIPELIDIVNKCKDNIIVIKGKADPLYSSTKNYLVLLENAISKEIANQSSIKFHHLKKLNIENFNDAIGDSTKNYLETLSDYYALKFNLNNIVKEILIMELEDEEASVGESLSLYNYLRDTYHNNYLAGIVKQKFSKNKIAREDTRLVQIKDPIYKDPEGSSYFDYRSHFYAPRKHFMGHYFESYNFNLFVLWFMAIILYITLYFELFRKGLSLFDKFKVLELRMNISNFR